ncbi:MAG: hypothetical protein WCI72_05285 [archaeon]
MKVLPLEAFYQEEIKEFHEAAQKYKHPIVFRKVIEVCGDSRNIPIGDTAIGRYEDYPTTFGITYRVLDRYQIPRQEPTCRHSFMHKILKIKDSKIIDFIRESGSESAEKILGVLGSESDYENYSYEDTKEEKQIVKLINRSVERIFSFSISRGLHKTINQGIKSIGSYSYFKDAERVDAMVCLPYMDEFGVVNKS